MYKINLEQNRIHKVPTSSFSVLGLKERNHLQEWLAHCPSALGEELLIIQKEFDGFDDTYERLDLLALDKQGTLVIIENKLDDSGRDVVWQALKYASYCSTLSKSQIVDIFQKYLDRQEHVHSDSAKKILCDFLEMSLEDFEATNLNQGNNQRIILVAANFRKEVTSTALWLLSNGLQLQCFKATPYQLDREIFMSLDQVIPIPETEDFMIRISAKEQEQQTIERSKSLRFSLRHAFWSQLLEALPKANISLFANIRPSKDHWLSTGSGISGVIYNIIFGRDFARVEFYLTRDLAEDNKRLFDALYARRASIEQRFGKELAWGRLDSKKACRIHYEAAFDGYNQEVWPEINAWMIEHIPRLERAFKPEMDYLTALLKKSLNSTPDGANAREQDVP